MRESNTTSIDIILTSHMVYMWPFCDFFKKYYQFLSEVWMKAVNLVFHSYGLFCWNK